MIDALVGSDAWLLVVAAHADDDALGAGGTIARARCAGAAVHVVVCSHSVLSRGLESGDAERVKVQRRAAVEAAASRLGASVTLLDLPDNAFESVPLLELVQNLEAVVTDFRPTAVLSHSAADLSRDHELVSRAVLTVARPLPGRPIALLAFEIRSATDWTVGTGVRFEPSVWVALDEQAWRTKLELLDIYARRAASVSARAIGRRHRRARALSRYAGRRRARRSLRVPPSGRAVSRESPPVRRGWYVRHGKRVLDLGLGGLLLVLSAPVQLAVAAVVRARLGRPVLLRQPRSGKGGRPFVILKFRTMKPTAASPNHSSRSLTSGDRDTPPTTIRVIRASVRSSAAGRSTSSPNS